ncbi:MAG: hypothetical protein KGI54_14315 [Pseudomonadota bacterium]|nr:hypothetical protein [Pseudomonadota bacterium]
MTVLSDKMRSLADKNHERRDDLRRLAQEFDEAATGFYAEPQTVDVKRFMGCWARAKRAWSECSGEPLI